MRLTVVGCAGSFPGPGVACSSYLVEFDGFRLLLDLGNGALGALQSFCDPRDVDALVISHLHGDHWLDVVPLAYARPHHPDGRVPDPLPLYVPDAGPLTTVLRRDVDRLQAVFDVRPIADGVIGPFAVRFHRTDHPVATYAIRVEAQGRSMGYTADTAWLDPLVEFFSGVDVLLAEATFPPDDDRVAPPPPGLHLNASEAGELARRAGARRLVVTHIPPWADVEHHRAAAEKIFGGPTIAARPALRVDL